MWNVDPLLSSYPGTSQSQYGEIQVRGRVHLCCYVEPPQSHLESYEKLVLLLPRKTYTRQ